MIFEGAKLSNCFFLVFHRMSILNLYPHSFEAGHHVFINLGTERVYCLPDGYEISDPSLDDIQHVLNPKFTEEQVEKIDGNKQWSRALDGSDYLAGMVGLNNIKQSDFVNVTVQSLMRVSPLRNFFLIPKNYEHCKSPLVHRFGELTRKIWHARNFKEQILKLRRTRASFMTALRGELEQSHNADGGVLVTESCRKTFLMLGLDMPPAPLFKDVMERNMMPQVPLLNIMKKFDGETVTEEQRYRVTRSPRYLILHMKRFTKNNSFVEKNPTLVNFPVKNLELRDDIPLPTPKENERLHSKVFVQRKSEEVWYEMQDLHVSEALPQMVALSGAYMQIYEQQQ
ncbi:hypothetical protein ACLB2K_061081 [Fragaria x ananassa]